MTRGFINIITLYHRISQWRYHLLHLLNDQRVGDFPPCSPGHFHGTIGPFVVPRCAGRRGGAQLGGGTSQDAEGVVLRSPGVFFLCFGVIFQHQKP